MATLKKASITSDEVASLNIYSTYTTATQGPIIYFSHGTTRKASVGYYNDLAYVGNESSPYAKIGITSNGTPVYSPDNVSHTYTLLHANNYTDYITKAKIIELLNLGSTRTSYDSMWGVLTTANGYTHRLVTDQAGGGGIAIAEKSGQTFLQVDGDIYVQEGQQKLATESWVTNKNYLTSHQDISGKLNGDNNSFIFNNKNIPEAADNLANVANTGAITFYKNGMLIPYTTANANDGGMIRCIGDEGSCRFEIATWDDSGAGETIQFNYYPTTSQITPTYSVTVPKKSGTIALTTDIPSSLPANGGTATYASYLVPQQNVTSYGQSTWDPTSSGKIIWGERFINTSISSDSGDFTLYLRGANGGTELCMNIDGDYYSMGRRMAYASEIPSINYTSGTLTIN